MFSTLQAVHEAEAVSGLAILALTRPYSPSAATDEARAAELDLIRTSVQDRGLQFRVGVMPDDRANRDYGATSIPTAVVIDRRGIVRYADTAGDEAELHRIVRQYLEAAD